VPKTPGLVRKPHPVTRPVKPDHEAAAQRMAEAIHRFLKMPQLKDKRLSSLAGAPETFDLVVARRRYLDELDRLARRPYDPLNGLHKG
jgi:hypothetical protein